MILYLKKFLSDNKKYIIELSFFICWLGISLFIIFDSVKKANLPEYFLDYFVVLNSVSAYIYYQINTSFITEKDAYKTRKGLLKRDLFFLFILFLGPFAVIPVFFLLVSKLGMNRGMLEKFYEYSNNDEDCIDRKIDLKSELKKQIVKQPVIDSAASEDKYKKRGAIEILFKLRTPEAVKTLKEITKDPNFEIRFFAINKLATMENDFLKEIDWYRTAIKTMGPSPELLFQYAALMMAFGQIGLLFPEFSSLYFKKAAKIFYMLKDEKSVMVSAWDGYARALRQLNDYSAAADFLESHLNQLDELGIRELLSCHFETRNFRKMEMIKEIIKNNGLRCGPALKKFIFEGNDEDLCVKDIYPLNSIDEIKNFIKKINMLDFDMVFLKIPGNISMSNLIQLCVFFEQSGKFWLYVFFKILKGRNEPEALEIVKKYIKNDDLSIALMALDLLTSYDLSMRTNIFIDLLESRHDPVRAAAVKFLGAQKVIQAYYKISQIYENDNSSVLKKLALMAVCEIDMSNSYDYVAAALNSEKKEILTAACEMVAKYKLTRFMEDTEKILCSASNDKIRLCALKAVIECAKDKAGEALIKNLTLCAEAFIKTAASEIKKMKRTDLIQALKSDINIRKFID